MSLLVYITTPTVEEAQQIGRLVVDERLAACANIMPGMQSIYRWQGQVQEAPETVLIIKTAESRYEALEARVKELHSYDTPCIVALAIDKAEPAYGRWIREQTEA